jgi:D-arabinose 1-dehydrogenase-like Zn-dependent alcohol dehydrogenase
VDSDLTYASLLAHLTSLELTASFARQAALMTSSSGAAYNEALEYLRPHGTLVAVGLPPDTWIKANVFWTVFKALRVSRARRSFPVFEQALILSS